ncbi:V-type ATP synthase subunit I [Aerococcaceae bacterium WGS1372]
MAISVMKRVLIVAEQCNKELLLESLQELKGTEIVSLNDQDDIDLAYFQQPTDWQGESDKSNRYMLSKIESAIEFLTPHVLADNLIDRLTKKRPVYSLKQLEQAVNSMNLDTMLKIVDNRREKLDQLERKLEELESKELFLRRWAKLEFLPQDTEHLAHYKVQVGSIDTEDNVRFIDQLDTQDHPVYLQEVYYTDDTMGYVLVYALEDEPAISEILTQMRFEALDYPYKQLASQELASVLEERARSIAEQNQIKKHLRSDKLFLANLKLAREYYENLEERQKASHLLLNSQHLFLLKGWITEDELNEHIEVIHETLGEDQVAFLTYDVDLEEDDVLQIPVKLKNNRFNKAFETFTLQYGTPVYNSVDPTPFFSLFQVLFFGLMSADLGYGLLLFLATAIPIHFFDLSESMKKNLLSFNYMSIGTMLVGLFFGSFFGFDMPFAVMNFTDQVIEVMVFSVAIGIIHMLVGYSLKLYLTMKDKDYTSMYLDSLQWMMILIGGVILAINAVLNIPLLNTVGLVLILGNIIGMFIVNMISASNPFVGFGQGLFGLIDVSGLIGDIVSYTRLTAIGVAGANIGMAFNVIVGLFPPIVRFTLGILLFVALHALNIFITFLGSYVHSMRLEFVEFFGKFYTSGGKAFEPLKAREREVWIKRDMNQ